MKTTESGGPRGFDAGKLVKGRKRHILTDTGGRLVAGMVHAAHIQDRDGAPPLLASIRWAFPWLRHVFADGAYAGPKLGKALEKIGQWTLEIVKRSDDVTASRSCPGVGWWSAPLPGSVATAVSPKTSRHHRQRRGLAHDRKHPTPHTKDRKALKSNNSFPAGLLRRNTRKLSGSSSRTAMVNLLWSLRTNARTLLLMKLPQKKFQFRLSWRTYRRSRPPSQKNDPERGRHFRRSAETMRPPRRRQTRKKHSPKCGKLPNGMCACRHPPYFFGGRLNVTGRKTGTIAKTSRRTV